MTPIFYLLKGGYSFVGCRIREFGFLGLRSLGSSGFGMQQLEGLAVIDGFRDLLGTLECALNPKLQGFRVLCRGLTGWRTSCNTVCI